MKKRLHDKRAGIAILLALILITLGEMIFRAVALGKAVLDTSNAGEQVAVIVLAVTILILTAKGKERVCYILYGAWLAGFVMDQIFGLPGIIAILAANISNTGIISIVIRMVAMICIIAIGALLVEYMNDGTIYNRAFNAFCIIAVLLFVADISVSIYNFVFSTSAALDVGVELSAFKKHMILITFNNAYYIVMIFLFSFFAYDSAKAQLKKTNLSQ